MHPPVVPAASMTTVAKVPPTHAAFAQSSLAPLMYLTLQITLVKMNVQIISMMNNFIAIPFGLHSAVNVASYWVGQSKAWFFESYFAVTGSPVTAFTAPDYLCTVSAHRAAKADIPAIYAKMIIIAKTRLFPILLTPSLTRTLSVTAGLKWAPEIAPNIIMLQKRIPPIEIGWSEGKALLQFTVMSNSPAPKNSIQEQWICCCVLLELPFQWDDKQK